MKPVGGDAWRGRLLNAKAFQDAAEHLSEWYEEGQNGNPIVVLIVLAAIGFGDAITAWHGGTVSQKDHAALPKAIRKALGNRADEEQLKRLRRILEEKDAASYGARIGRMEHARQLLEQLRRFGSWVEQTLD